MVIAAHPLGSKSSSFHRKLLALPLKLRLFCFKPCGALEDLWRTNLTACAHWQSARTLVTAPSSTAPFLRPEPERGSVVDNNI